MLLKIPLYKTILLGILLMPLFTMAQTFSFQQYTTREGLPIDNVYAAAQDDQGYMWFGTDFGIAFYDGYRFKTYSKNEGMANKAVTDIVFAGGDSLIFLSYPSTIQAIHINGRINTIIENAAFALQQIARHEDEFYCYKRGAGKYGLLKQGKYQLLDIDSVLGSNNAVINAIVDLNEKGVAFCTNKGLFIKDGIRVQLYLHDQNIQFTIYTQNKTVLAVNNSGLLESAANMGFKELPYHFPKDFVVYHAAQQNENTFWFRGIDKGVYRLFDGKLQEMSDRLRLENKAMNEFFKDSDGNFWFCTDGSGILLKKRSAFINYETTDGLANNKVLRMLKQNSSLLIGTSNGLSVLKDNHISKINLPQSATGLKYVSQLFQVDKDIAGISIAGTFTFDTNQNSINAYVKDIVTGGLHLRAYANSFAWQQDDNNIWLLSQSYIVNVQKKPLKKTVFNLSDYKVRKGFCMIAYENKLWLGTDAGLIFIDKEMVTNKDSVGNEKLGQVFDFLIDSKNRLWIATDNGLFRYEHNSFTAIERGATFGSNYCRSIAEDDAGRIWAATWDGIFVVDGKTIRTYNTSDGLPSKTCNKVLYDAPAAALYIGTDNGMAVINKADFLTGESKRKLFINCNITGDEAKQVDEKSILQPDQNNLGFYISLPFYGVTGNINYEYKIDNGEWIQTNKPNIFFNNLATGDHDFYARASLDAKMISRQDAVFSFTIKKQWYKKWWVWILPALLVQFIIFRIINYYTKKAREVKLAGQSQQAEYASLKQQAFTLMMNPHFIFNALNSVQYYVNKQDRQSANKYLSDFATLIRRSFDAAQRSFVTLDEELETIRLYLQLEKMRFVDKFEYIINVSREAEDDEWMLPSMMLQPFLENAVLHGLMPLHEKGWLTIDATVQQNSLCITITDNGIGIEKSKAFRSGVKHNSKGMQLIKERIVLLSKLGKDPIQLIITDLNPGAENPGTKITMIIPQEIFEAYKKQTTLNN